MAWRTAASPCLRGATSEGFEHRRHQGLREALREAVDRLVLAIEEGAGGVPHVVFVVRGKGVVLPYRLRRPDLRVLDAGRQDDRVAAGLRVGILHGPLVAEAY